MEEGVIREDESNRGYVEFEDVQGYQMEVVSFQLDVIIENGIWKESL